MKKLWMIFVLYIGMPYTAQAEGGADRDNVKFAGKGCMGVIALSTLGYLMQRESNSSKIQALQTLQRRYEFSYDCKPELHNMKNIDELREFSDSPSADRIAHMEEKTNEIFLSLQARYKSPLKPWNWGKNMATAYEEAKRLKEEVELASRMHESRDWLKATPANLVEVARIKGCGQHGAHVSTDRLFQSYNFPHFLQFPVAEGLNDLRSHIEKIKLMHIEQLAEQQRLLLATLEGKCQALIASPEYSKQAQELAELIEKSRAAKVAESNAQNTTRAAYLAAHAATVAAHAEMKKADAEHLNAQARMLQATVAQEQLALQRAAQQRAEAPRDTAQPVMGVVVGS